MLRVAPETRVAPALLGLYFDGGAACTTTHARIFMQAKAGRVQLEPLGYHFVHFWGQGMKMLKLSLLGLILATPEAKAGKCSN